MSKAGVAQPLPDNNDCPMHPEYSFTCGTCNGLFDKDGNPTPQEPSLTPDSIKTIGKLDMLNNLFRDGAVAVILDKGKAVVLKIGNSDYYFNPPTKTEEYEGLDGKTHTRTELKYDGWEKHL